MTRKMYFGNTVEAAMALARRELGDEVWLVSARPARTEESSWGAYAIEVAAEAVARQPEPAPAEPAVRGTTLATELSEVRHELARLQQALASSAVVSAPARVMPPVWARQNIRLRASGVPAELASEWIVLAQDRAGLSPEPGAAEEMLRTVMGERLAVMAPGDGPARRRIALVGPPGAGKTTLLVKLAWKLGLQGRRTMGLLTTDTQRIAAADQLRSYAALMGVPCKVADTPWSFRQAWSEYSATDVVLVDTPGFAARETEALELAAGSWPEESEIETHLVLSAQASPADLWSAVVRFAPFQAASLAFTRLDETSSTGALAAVAARARLPVSYLSFGQSVPEDFEPATTARLCEWIFGDVRLPGADVTVRGAAA